MADASLFVEVFDPSLDVQVNGTSPCIGRRVLELGHAPKRELLWKQSHFQSHVTVGPKSQRTSSCKREPINRWLPHSSEGAIHEALRLHLGSHVPLGCLEIAQAQLAPSRDSSHRIRHGSFYLTPIRRILGVGSESLVMQPQMLLLLRRHLGFGMIALGVSMALALR